MGIAQITPPPLCQMGKYGRKKSTPNHPGKPLHPRANVGKKVGLTILASLYTHTLSGYAHAHCLQIAQQEYMFLNCGITFKRHFQEAQIVMSLTGCPNVLK